MKTFVLVKKILDGPELFWSTPYGSSGYWTPDLNSAKHYANERGAVNGWTAVSKRHTRIEVKEIELKNEEVQV